jgi:hypothetical protein
MSRKQKETEQTEMAKKGWRAEPFSRGTVNYWTMMR